jgi:Flp pilus assembly pilin Flp
MRRFVTNSAGATAIENAVIAALIALALTAAAHALGPALSAVFEETQQAIENALGDDGTGVRPRARGGRGAAP